MSTKVIDLFVVYQEEGLTLDTTVEMPAGLSNTECINFVRASLSDGASILNIINIDSINRQKSVPTAAAPRVERNGPKPAFA